MRLHSALAAICLMTSVLGLILAYGASSYQPVLIFLPVMLAFWVLARRMRADWRASVLLCTYLALAAAGMILKQPALPLALGSLAALLWWDLVEFSADAKQPALLNYRLQSLAITAFLSLLLQVASLWLPMRLPFGIIAVLALAVTACLVYVSVTLRKASAAD